MRSFKTKQGTELPLISLQGKEYLNVQWRLVWMREEHPEWSIISELVSFENSIAIFRATIKDLDGHILSQSHKVSNDQRYPIERAETGAIGRALALMGYGTQFCGDELGEDEGGLDLDEGDEIADAPVERRTSRVSQIESPQMHMGPPTPFKNKQTADFGDIVMKFGTEYKGKKLKDIPEKALLSAAKWARSIGKFDDICLAIDGYLATKKSQVVMPPKELSDLKNKLGPVIQDFEIASKPNNGDGDYGEYE